MLLQCENFLAIEVSLLASGTDYAEGMYPSKSTPVAHRSNGQNFLFNTAMLTAAYKVLLWLYWVPVQIAHANPRSRNGLGIVASEGTSTDLVAMAYRFLVQSLWVFITLPKKTPPSIPFYFCLPSRPLLRPETCCSFPRSVRPMS